MKHDFNKIEIYGYWGLIKLFLNLIRTRVVYSKVRIIRFPIEIRGRKYIDFGSGLTTGVNCRIEAYPTLFKQKIIKFGKNVEINDFVHIAGIKSILIGDNVLIASKVFISDIQHGNYSGVLPHDSPNTIPSKRKLYSKNVVIGDNVWIGESVSILAGVTIGKGTIIGSNSVVSKSLPENVIAVGIPAIPVKKYNFECQKWENV